MAGLDHDAGRFMGLSEAQKDEIALEKKAAAETDADSLSGMSQHAPDGIHDGLTFPTAEERTTLRRVADTIPWNAYSASFPLSLWMGG